MRFSRSQISISSCSRSRTAAFSLIELLVVIGIILIILAVALPGVAALTKGNNVKQGGNMASAYIASARASAMAARRQVAIIFYEETAANALPYNRNQTAVQIAIEDTDQTTGSPSAGNTIFIPYRAKEYLPAGVRVATFNGLIVAAGVSQIAVNENTASGAKARAIVFNADGQLVIRSGLAARAPTGGAGAATQVVGDWNLILPAGSATDATSAPGVILFDGPLFAEQNFASDAARTTWLQKNADVLVVNSYTGNVIR